MSNAPGTIKPYKIGKIIVFGVLALFLLYMIIMLVLSFINGRQETKDDSNVLDNLTLLEQELVQQAQQIYEKKKAEGFSFFNGPCLSNNLASVWVVDLVHNPRQDVDDLPENQCPSFVTGERSKVIEFDLDGNLIRAK
jgi:hypothetical protein